MRGQILPPTGDQGQVGLDRQAAYSPHGSQVLWPVAPSGDGQGSRVNVRATEPFALPSMSPNLGVNLNLPEHAGDGHPGVAASMPYVPQASRSIPTPKGEVMKLVMLVVFFLLWISTASTLLFLYMDRYLFPG
jgi:hypothetical protein